MSCMYDRISLLLPCLLHITHNHAYTTANACKFTITGGITLHISIKYAPLSLPHFMPAHSGDPHTERQQQQQHQHQQHRHHNALNNSSNTNAADLSANNANSSNPNTNTSNSHGTTTTAVPTFTPGSLLGSFLDPAAAQNTPMLLFEVKDTGVGIPDDNKGALFQAFGQTQKFQSQGTGLGLYSVAQKALKLGGTYGLLDNRPTGSNFFFAVPYMPEEDMNQLLVSEQELNSATGMSTKDSDMQLQHHFDQQQQHGSVAGADDHQYEYGQQQQYDARQQQPQQQLRSIAVDADMMMDGSRRPNRQQQQRHTTGRQHVQQLDVSNYGSPPSSVKHTNNDRRDNNTNNNNNDTSDWPPTAAAVQEQELKFSGNSLNNYHQTQSDGTRVHERELSSGAATSRLLNMKKGDIYNAAGVILPGSPVSSTTSINNSPLVTSQQQQQRQQQQQQLQQPTAVVTSTRDINRQSPPLQHTYNEEQEASIADTTHANPVSHNRDPKYAPQQQQQQQLLRQQQLLQQQHQYRSDSTRSQHTLHTNNMIHGAPSEDDNINDSRTNTNDDAASVISHTAHEQYPQVMSQQLGQYNSYNTNSTVNGVNSSAVANGSSAPVSSMAAMSQALSRAIGADVSTATSTLPRHVNSSGMTGVEAVLAMATRKVTRQHHHQSIQPAPPNTANNSASVYDDNEPSVMPTTANRPTSAQQQQQHEQQHRQQRRQQQQQQQQDHDLLLSPLQQQQQHQQLQLRPHVKLTNAAIAPSDNITSPPYGTTATSGSASVSGSDSGKKSILIIDDTKSVRTLVGKALSWWGFESVYATNGSEGLEAMKSRSFELVISDLQMPVVSVMKHYSYISLHVVIITVHYHDVTCNCAACTVQSMRFYNTAKTFQLLSQVCL
jgi:CheY-like chemotaxis protein